MQLKGCEGAAEKVQPRGCCREAAVPEAASKQEARRGARIEVASLQITQCQVQLRGE